MTSSFGMAFGPIGGGWIFDTFGTYHWLYIASAPIGLAAAGMALAFPPAPKPEQRGEGVQPERCSPPEGVCRQGMGGPPDAL